MFAQIKTIPAVILSIGFSAAAMAGDHAQTTWTLDGASSKIAFGSIKSNEFGEVHSFEEISGMVTPDGATSIDIALGSVQTNIDIRNERMIEHVFNSVPNANITAQINMDEVAALDVGATTVIEVEGVLSLLGVDVDLETEMFVARLSETSVLVSTNDMLFLSSEDAGIDEGVTKLMELAGLPGITRTAPVTLRLVFEAQDKKAEASSILEPGLNAYAELDVRQLVLSQ